MNDLREGKAIAVESKVEEKKEAEGEGKKHDSEAVLEQVDGYKANQLLQIQDEFKDLVYECKFVVKESYDYDGNYKSTDYKFHRYIAGSQEDIDLFKSWMDENIKGDFELVDE